MASYDALVKLHPSPIILLNRAIAVSYGDGPEAGLELLAQVEAGGDLEFYPLLPAVRADLLRRANRRDEAVVAYRRAIDQAGTDIERRLLQRRLDELTSRRGR